MRADFFSRMYVFASTGASTVRSSVWSLVILAFLAFLAYLPNSSASTKNGLLLERESIYTSPANWLTTNVRYEKCQNEAQLRELFESAVAEGIDKLRLINPQLVDEILKGNAQRKLTVFCDKPLDSVLAEYQPNTLFQQRRIKLRDFFKSADELGLDLHAKRYIIFHEYLHFSRLPRLKNHDDLDALLVRRADGRFQIETDSVYACALSAFPSFEAYAKLYDERLRVRDSMRATCSKTKSI